MALMLAALLARQPDGTTTAGRVVDEKGWADCRQ